MGMHIKIRQRSDTDYIKLDKKLKIARIISKELNLKIKYWEIWKDNIAKSIGGSKLKEINFDSELPHELVEKYDLNKIIIYGKGTLTLPEKIELIISDREIQYISQLPARIIIYNNKSLRSTYFDFDIDTGDLPFYLLLKNGVYDVNYLNERVHNIIEKMRDLRASIEKVIVSDDPISTKILYNRYFTFFDDFKTFLQDFFSSLKKTSEILENNTEISNIVNLIEPYDMEYFADVVADELYRNKKYLDKLSEIAGVKITYSSVVLYGNEKIDTLYKLLIKDFKEKVIKNLPEKKKIDGILKEWVK